MGKKRKEVDKAIQVIEKYIQERDMELFCVNGYVYLDDKKRISSAKELKEEFHRLKKYICHGYEVVRLDELNKLIDIINFDWRK